MADISTLLALQIICIFILPLCCFLAAFPACLLKRNLTDPKSYVSCWSNVIAGSVILGFGLTHIFPDAIEEYESSFSEKLNGFPLPFVIAVVTLLLIITAEKAILSAMHNHQLRKALVEGGKHEHVHPVDEEQHHIFHSHDIEFPLNEDGSMKAQAYVLTVGICFHSIFEGLALGFAGNVADIVVLMIGILVHKLAEAFVVGTTLTKTNVSRVECGLIFSIFAFTAPVGLVIAILVKENADDFAEAVASSILNSIATGVFLYISIVTLFVELVDHKQRWFKLFVSCTIVISTAFLHFLE